MKKTTVILLFVSLLVQACATSEELSKIIKPKEIERLGYFTPISYMGIIEKGNKGTRSESLSKESTGLLDSLIAAKKQTFHIQSDLTPADTIISNRLNKEISNLVFQATTKTKVININLSPTVDSVMEANQERFAVALVATGFSRVKGNYGGQVAKGIGVGLLTLGMYTPVPVKANSTIHAVIFDAKNNTVALYKRSQLVDKEPTDRKVLNKQVNSVLTNLLKS
jgi:hypothetical protein